MDLHLAALTTADAIVFTVCAVFALRGAWKGFAWQAVRTLGLLGALWGAGAWHRSFGAWLDAHVPFIPAAAAPWVAWILILAGLVFVATFFAWMARGALRSIQLGGVDRLLGFAMGAAMGLLLSTVGFLVYGSFASDASLDDLGEGSITVPWMAEVADHGSELLPPDVRDRWQRVLDTLREASE